MGGTTSPDIAARERGAVRYWGRLAGGRPSLRAPLGGAGGRARLAGNQPAARLRRGGGAAGDQAVWHCSDFLWQEGRAPGLSGWDAGLPTRPGGWLRADGGPGSPEAAAAHACEPTSLSLGESWAASVSPRLCPRLCPPADCSVS